MTQKQPMTPHIQPANRQLYTQLAHWWHQYKLHLLAVLLDHLSDILNWMTANNTFDFLRTGKVL